MWDDLTKFKMGLLRTISFAIVGAAIGLFIIKQWEQALAYSGAVSQAKLQLKAKAADEFSQASYYYTSVMYDAHQKEASHAERIAYESDAYDRYRIAKNQLAVYFDIDTKKAKLPYHFSTPRPTKLLEAWGRSTDLNKDLNEAYQLQAAGMAIERLENDLGIAKQSKDPWTIQKLEREFVMRAGKQRRDAGDRPLRAEATLGNLRLAVEQTPATSGKTTQAMNRKVAAKRLIEKLKELKPLNEDTPLAKKDLESAVALVKADIKAKITFDFKEGRKALKAEHLALSQAAVAELMNVAGPSPFSKQFPIWLQWVGLAVLVTAFTAFWTYKIHRSNSDEKKKVKERKKEQEKREEQERALRARIWPHLYDAA